MQREVVSVLVLPYIIFSNMCSSFLRNIATLVVSEFSFESLMSRSMMKTYIFVSLSSPPLYVIF